MNYNTIEYKFYCQLPPHGGFSETSINSTGNQKKKKRKKKYHKLIINKLLRNYLQSLTPQSVNLTDKGNY